MSARVPHTSDFPVRVPAPRLSERLPLTPPKLPAFPLDIPPPDLSPWLEGNSGLPGVHQLKAEEPGPHVAVTALMHGNEYAGAVILDELLRSALRPKRGTLSIIFLNIAAFLRFDPTRPTASRFVEYDMNRLWGASDLASSRHSIEQDRVRLLFPLIETVDYLLDLHSMLWPADPLFLAGTDATGLDLARRIGLPDVIVSDPGHVAGRRLIDMPHFTAPGAKAGACLLEAGQHWAHATLDVTRRAVHHFLSATGIAAEEPRELEPASPLCVTVTECVTARTAGLTFVKPFRSGEIIRQRATLLAVDGPDEIRTPYDNCMLVMPNFRTARGHTAVRLARLMPDTP